MREWLTRGRDWLRRDALDAELDEELAFHRAQLERDARAAGASADEAAWAARRALGSTLRAKAAARERWSLPALDRVLHDVRYALRGLARSPGFTLAVVVTLGLGLGANVAMFGVVDRLLFRPPPLLRDPATAHRVYVYVTRRGEETPGGGSQYARYRDVATYTHSFASVAGYALREMPIGTGDATRQMQVGVVSPSFFGFFDAAPTLGRYYTEAEDRPPSGAPVVVLSYAFWQTRYGGRRDVLGTTLPIGSTTYTVIGVAPRGFVGLWPDQPPAAFVPLAAYAASEGPRLTASWWTSYGWGWMSTLARRKQGVSTAAANADLTSALRRSFEAAREQQPGSPPLSELRPRGEVGSILFSRGPNASPESKVATWVAGVSGVVLLIACANVANLLLARALRRRREIALRLALGVTRRRLLAQLWTESMLLAVLGGAVGLAVAHWGGAVLRALLLEKSEAPAGMHDPRTVWFAAGAALATGALMGLAPMVQAGRVRLTSDIRAGARGGIARRESRLRSVLLVVQGALCVSLLVGAGLFVRSLRHVQQVRLGYDVDPVLLVDLSMRGLKLDSARMVALRGRLLDAAKATPGVQSASLRISVPFWDYRNQSLYVEGIDSVARLGQFYYNAVGPEHFATVGTRVIRGRAIEPGDRDGAPRVMVVSESMARVLWPGKDPLGRCVRLRADTAPCTQVVGVAENIKADELGAEPDFHYYYVPAAQFAPQTGGLFVRVRADAARMRETLRARLQREMPGASYVTVTPFSDAVGERKQSWRLGATMFVAFGALALVIAAVGLYSVIAYDVAQRAHELSVRVALGARARDVVRLVVARGVYFALAGIALGAGAALLAARRLQPLLFEQSATDPSVYLAVGAALLLVAVAASASPALRASRADPNAALRTE
ncbi:permease [Gemmatirosa kalamazoonensis]|uniref:Permease n=1 Tax=Gemmatirosa kalamazoonensis TaxID=861299 RepID=W0RHM3_9BACT|nr:ADOP family duplicated permease [Gemmatirosa kalamazoonensis]AHG88903.1 permease [Gemmatirosa kalamazoonensis]